MQTQDICSFLTPVQPINEIIIEFIENPTLTACVSKGFLINSLPFLQKIFNSLQKKFPLTLSQEITIVNSNELVSIRSYLRLCASIKNIYQQITSSFSGIAGVEEKMRVTKESLQISHVHRFHENTVSFFETMWQWQCVEETRNLITIFQNKSELYFFLKNIGALTLDYANSEQVAEVRKKIDEMLEERSELVSIYGALDLCVIKNLKLTLFPSQFLSMLQGLKILNLNAQQIEVLPKTIGNLKNLTSLNLNGNKLKRLPEEIGHLNQLRHLDLSGNSLKTLPDELWQLTSLTHLYLSAIQLKTLSPLIGQLT